MGSPEAACRALAVAQCEKAIECTPEQARALDPKLKDQATCEASLKQQLKCDNITTVCGGDAEKYSPQRAQTCISELRALTCNDIISGQTEAKAPTCSKVCTE